MSRRVSPTQFVIRGVPAAELEERLGRDCRVKTLGESVAIVEFGSGAVVDPKVAWNQLQERAGREAVVAPVLLDDRGEMAYPTGQIQVRFLDPPSEDLREAFAARNGMRLVECNKYQPAQLLFEPIDPRAYLPELVLKLEAAEGVKRAWEVTEALYRRGKATH